MDVKDILKKYANDKSLIKRIQRDIFENDYHLDVLDGLDLKLDINDNGTIDTDALFILYLNSKIKALHLLNLFRNNDHFSGMSSSIIVPAVQESCLGNGADRKPNEDVVLKSLVEYVILSQVLLQRKDAEPTDDMEVDEQINTPTYPVSNRGPMHDGTNYNKKIEFRTKKSDTCTYCDTKIEPDAIQCSICEAAVENNRRSNDDQDILVKQKMSSASSDLNHKQKSVTLSDQIFSKRKRKSTVSTQNDDWKCEYCDLINDKISVICGTCNAPPSKGKKYPKPKDDNNSHLLSSSEEQHPKILKVDNVRADSENCSPMSSSDSPVLVARGAVRTLDNEVQMEIGNNIRNSSWLCDQCGFRNSGKNSLNCEACYSSGSSHFHFASFPLNNDEVKERNSLLDGHRISNTNNGYGSLDPTTTNRSRDATAAHSIGDDSKLRPLTMGYSNIDRISASLDNRSRPTSTSYNSKSHVSKTHTEAKKSPTRLEQHSYTSIEPRPQDRVGKLGIDGTKVSSENECPHWMCLVCQFKNTNMNSRNCITCFRQRIMESNNDQSSDGGLSLHKVKTVDREDDVMEENFSDPSAQPRGTNKQRNVIQESTMPKKERPVANENAAKYDISLYKPRLQQSSDINKQPRMEQPKSKMEASDGSSIDDDDRRPVRGKSDKSPPQTRNQQEKHGNNFIKVHSETPDSHHRPENPDKSPPWTRNQPEKHGNNFIKVSSETQDPYHRTANPAAPKRDSKISGPNYERNNIGFQRDNEQGQRKDGDSSNKVKRANEQSPQMIDRRSHKPNVEAEKHRQTEGKSSPMRPRIDADAEQQPKSSTTPLNHQNDERSGPSTLNLDSTSALVVSKNRSTNLFSCFKCQSEDDNDGTVAMCPCRDYRARSKYNGLCKACFNSAKLCRNCRTKSGKEEYDKLCEKCYKKEHACTDCGNNAGEDKYRGLCKKCFKRNQRSK